MRADGLSGHFAAFGCGYTGEVLAFGETCLFKVPMSSSRQQSSHITKHKAEANFVRGLWVGKHDASDDHLLVTASGWHRARTVRRLESSKRASVELFADVAGAPWDRRTAAPTRNRLRKAAIPPVLPRLAVVEELGAAPSPWRLSGPPRRPARSAAARRRRLRT